MNCRPNSRVLVVRPCIAHVCGSRLLGCPVDIGELAQPGTLFDAIAEVVEGPMWLLKQAHACPSGSPSCAGLDRLPDRCLRPFDPDAEPGEEDNEGSEPDVGRNRAESGGVACLAGSGS